MVVVAGQKAGEAWQTYFRRTAKSTGTYGKAQGLPLLLELVAKKSCRQQRDGGTWCGGDRFALGLMEAW